MNKQGIHRVTSSSKRGRQMISPGRELDRNSMFTAAELAHNNAVDQKNRAKAERKLNKGASRV